MTLPAARLANRFHFLSHLPLLGLGTIWIGRRWPITNASYNSPSDEEVDFFLKQAFDAGLYLWDTAAAYGESERRLGRFLRQHPDILSSITIATKWGECFDPSTELVTITHTLPQLIDSFANSQRLLPKIDIFYIHQANVTVLSDLAIRDYMKRLVTENKIQFTGASISKCHLLEEAVNQNQIWTDFLQTSADIAAERPDLIEKVYKMGVAVVVNSPIRKNTNIRSPQEAYLAAAKHPYVSMVLTGTRTHLAETIGYFL